MPTTATGIETLNSLLRGELAATETYQQAMAKVGDEPWAEELRRIHREHREAANTLRQHVHHFGGKPDQGSGAWGAFSKAIEGAATLLGNKAALGALKQGEEHGIDTYQDALNDTSLPEECKALVLTTLLPQTREHVTTLERLMEKK